MSLKVIIPKGRTEITVNGLHQWDYGRTIEIHADGLPAMVEVHFACAGMSEAVVRNCAVVDGVATAAVPDICLEQTTPIWAWVYEIGETTGETILTITLPIISRTKPQPGATVPQDVSDKYTEAVAAMNELVAECEQTIQDTANELEERVAENLYQSHWKARHAEHAYNADEAAHAVEADHATDADFAHEAVAAETAEAAETANLLLPKPLTPISTGGLNGDRYNLARPGVYLAVIEAEDDILTSIICVKSIGQVAYGSAALFGAVTPLTDKVTLICDANGDLSAYHSGTSFADSSLPILYVYELATLPDT